MYRDLWIFLNLYKCVALKLVKLKTFVLNTVKNLKLAIATSKYVIR